MKQIFVSGNIFGKTNKDENSIFVNNGKIVFCGAKKEVLLQEDKETKVEDLQGKKIIPAFYTYVKSFYKKSAKNNKFKSKTAIFLENIENLQRKCICSGIATVIYIVQDENEFTDLKLFSEEQNLKIDFLCFIDIVRCRKVMDENCSSFHKYKNHLKIGGYFLQIDGEHETHEAWVKKKYKGTQNLHGYPLVNEKHLEYYIKNSFEDKKQIIVEANGDRSVELCLDVFEKLKTNEKFSNAKILIQHNENLKIKEAKKFSELYVGLIKICKNKKLTFFANFHENKQEKMLSKFGINHMISFENLCSYEPLFLLQETKRQRQKLNSISVSPSELFEEHEKGEIETGKTATFCIVSEKIQLVLEGEKK